MNEERSPIDTKVMMAFAVLVALVLLLPTYWEWIGFKPAPKPISKMADSTATAFPSAADTSSLSNRSTIRSRITNDSAKSIFVVDSAWSGETVQVTTPKYEASFSTQGARLARLVLKDYRYTDPERHDQPIVLLDTVDAAAGGGPGFQFDSPEIDLSLAQFRVDRTSVSLAKEDSGSVRFTVRTKSGNEWAVIYTFRGDRYDFQTRLLVPAPWQDGVERELHYGWQGGLWPTEPDPAGDNNDFAAVALMGKDLERIGKVDHDQPVSNLSGQTYWAAVRTKYFVCATIPATEAGGFRSVGRERFIPFEGKTIPLKQFDALVRVDLRTGEPIDLAFRVYAGPIDYDVLKSYGVGLEQMVNLGWRWLVRPFALVFLWLFQRLYAVFANYGIVIIIFSLLIKTIFHPLTKKQIRSMRKMQALQPKMEKLKERFKDDAQRLNQEMMKMYREAGINPMAGCLPLLPQMPIFYALFQVFRTSIELRGAHFVFWLTDLSQKDPYYILPILMTICMFAQQTLSTKDPKQKMMTYMMPLLFGFMFRNFPAGLTLYWTMFNIFSIIEQVWLIGHPSEDATATAEVGTGKIVKTKVGH